MPLISQSLSRATRLVMTLWCLLSASTRLAQAEEPTPANPSTQTFMLGVVVNDQPTDAIAAFKRLPNGRFVATPGDLETAGIRSKIGKLGPDGLIDLDTLVGVTWRYDEPRQLILFTAPDAARVPKRIDIGSTAKPIDFSHVRSNLGFVLNYTLYGATGWGGGSHKAFSGSFDARLLTPYGVTSTSALGKFDAFVDKTSEFSNGLTRLDSTWRYTDPERALVYQAGDSISGSLPWSSSWRFGGIQFKRNFAIRPDLVISPVPNLSGSASLPSSLDLYLNNIKVFSGNVPAGPFDFRGLPFINGNGDASIVMRDALGREILTRYAYYYGPNMVGKGIFDFSTELGFLRLGYGENSFEYDQNLAGSASVRYGLTDWLTTEGHFEATRGLVNGGAGFITSLGSFGSLSASLAVSRYSGAGGVENGGKATVTFQTGYNGYSFYADTSRSFGDYNDIGLVVDRLHGAKTPVSVRARSIDNVGVSFPLFFDPSSLGINFSRVRGAGKGDDASLLSVSWSRTVFEKASLYATAYTDFEKRKNYGFFVGFSIPIGDNMTASVSVDSDGVDTTLTKSARLGEDPIAWSLRDRENLRGEGNRSATVDYRSSFGEFSGSVDQAGDMGRITATADGALIIAGGGIFFVNQVSDSFAVVKGGGPNAPVSLNGRHVANTNSSGHAVVPDLQSYQNNTVTIDPTNLAVDLQPESTQAIVVPADRSGVVIDFGTKRMSAATVILTNAEGKPLPMGAEVLQDGTGQPAVMGYDGRVWLTDLSPKNNLTITLPEGLGTCHASFDYKPVPGSIPEIGGVICK